MRVTVALAVACLIVGMSVAQESGASIKKYDLNIPRQALDTALKDLAQQTGLQIARFSDTIDGAAVVGPVSGSLTTQQALENLLSAQGLSYKVVNDRTIAIVKPGTEAAESQGEAGKPIAGVSPVAPAIHPAEETSAADNTESKSSSKSFWQRLRLAQSDSAASQNSSQSSDENSGGADAKPGSGAKLEEVVVTAQKREQSIKDVPLSITAISPQDLDRRGIQKTADLALSVPGLSVYELGAGRQIIAIRGMSTQLGVSALTGVYLDDVPTSGVTGKETPSYLDLRTLDLARVEVLKGPQGTLFGEGSVGGVIRYVTRDPELGEISGKVEGTVYDTKDGDLSKETVGILNVPMGDIFAVRVAATYEDKGGWIDKPATGDRDFNDSLVKNARVKALLAPSNEFSIVGMFNIHRNDGGGSNIVDLKPYSRSEFQTAFDVTAPTRYRDNYELYALTVKYDLGFAELLSATSHWKSDSLYSYTQFLDGDPDPYPLLEILVRNSEADASTTSQELRLASSGSGPFKWIAGANYKKSKLAGGSGAGGVQARLFGGPDPFILDNFEVNRIVSNESTALAGFADGSYTFGSLEVGGGLRYFHDRRNTFELADRGGTYQSGSFKKWTYRVYARYALTESSNVYVNVATGFRSGGFNPLSQVILGASETYRPETTLFYEVGTKNTFFDGRAGFDLALFTGEYKDRLEGVTRVSPVDPDATVDYTINSGVAKIKGAEWLLSWRLLGGLQLNFGGDVIDAKNTFVINPLGPAKVGDWLNYVPRHSVMLSGNYAFQWGANVAGNFDVSFNQKGKATATYRNGLSPDPVGRSPTVNFLQASVGAEWNGLEVRLFARNILDERQPIAPSETGATPQARPTSIGVIVGKTF